MKACQQDMLGLGLAAVLLLVCLLRPTLPMEQKAFRYLFILDITQSMNTPDYHLKELPADRLSLSKLAVRKALRTLPCGSEAGIGLFPIKEVLLLLDPLEVCEHFTVLDDSVSHIDWRMAWGPDSNVERGLYGSILATKRLAVPTHLVFITDGEQNVKELHRPPLNRYHGMISGFIFGAGGLVPSPIPKLDQNNQLTGYWKNAEVEEYKISLDRVENAMSEELDPQSNYWSRLHQEDLQVLAGITGLIYQRLESPEQFSKTLISDTFAEPRSIESDVRGFIATLALLLLLAVYIRQFGPENN